MQKQEQKPIRQKPKAMRKSKHDDVSPDELRVHRLVVFLSGAELDDLKTRSQVSKLTPAEFVRTVIDDASNLPKPIIIPSVNLELARSLGRSLGNLSTIATAMRKGGFVNFDEIAPLVCEVQNQLRGVK